jgi:hypothetical protein
MLAGRILRACRVVPLNCAAFVANLRTMPLDDAGRAAHQRSIVLSHVAPESKMNGR